MGRKKGGSGPLGKKVITLMYNHKQLVSNVRESFFRAKENFERIVEHQRQVAETIYTLSIRMETLVTLCLDKFQVSREEFEESYIEACQKITSENKKKMEEEVLQEAQNKLDETKNNLEESKIEEADEEVVIFGEDGVEQ